MVQIKWAGQDTYKLAKVVGAFVVMISAISNEYGAGINYVAVNSLSVYPSMRNLIPVAMFMTGLLLIPKVYMYQMYAKVASRAGSSYVWIGRSLHPYLGFVMQFIFWFSVVGSIGFVSYAVGTTTAQAFSYVGFQPGTWFATQIGHIVIGITIIWLVFLLHYTGVRNYGFVISILFALILFSATSIIIIGMTTSPATFTSIVQTKIINKTVVAPNLPPVGYSAFFGTMTIFLFAYGGLSAAPSLGGEVRNPEKDVSRGIIYAWLTSIVLFSLVTFAIFHVSEWPTTISLLGSNQSYYATAPGIISLVAPHLLGIVVTIVVTIVLAKTLAPLMLSTSRTLFAFGEDRIFPTIFTRTNKHKAPHVALFISAFAGSLILIEVSIVGWSIAVILRAISILLMIAFLGFGVLNLALKREKVEWQKKVSGAAMIFAAIAGIAIAFVMIPSVLIQPHQPLEFQPYFQLAVSVMVSTVIYLAAKLAARQRGENLEENIVSRLPLE